MNICFMVERWLRDGRETWNSVVAANIKSLLRRGQSEHPCTTKSMYVKSFIDFAAATLQFLCEVE